jgi:hypothetical protein
MVGTGLSSANWEPQASIYELYGVMSPSCRSGFEMRAAMPPPLRVSRRCRYGTMAIGLVVIVGAIVMVLIADDATPWLVVGFVALVVLSAVALKKDVT